MAGKEYRLTILMAGKDTGAKTMLSGLGSAFGSLGSIAGGILGAGLFIGLANQVKAFATEAISATANVQRMQMMLQTLQARELIKSGDFTDMNKALEAAGPLAKKTMDELMRIAIVSPYQVQNVQDTYRMAMAFGYTSTEASMFTKAILNMGAGVGAGSEQLDRMSYNLAQIRMVGKVTALDIRQLAMAGLDLNDVLKYVGKQMGVNIKDHLDFNKAIETGKITWADFTKYFAEYADVNFGGAAERMSRTLDGLKSTFKDVFALSMPAILGPAAEEVTSLLNDILTSFMGIRDSGALDVLGTNLAEKIKPGIDALRGFLEEVGIIVPQIDERYKEDVEKIDFGTAIKKKIDEINWPGIVASIGTGIVSLTAGFKKWADDIDWAKISTDLAAGIDSIDWASLGENVREGAKNIWDGIAIAASEIDWWAIGVSAGTGLGNFIAGLTGQGNIENVRTTWENNILQAFDINEKLWTIFYNYGPQIISGLLAGLIGVPGVLMLTVGSWLPSVTGAIEGWRIGIIGKLQSLAIQFYTSAVTWVQESARAVSFSITNIITQITAWTTPIFNALKAFGLMFYERAAAWVQQAARGIIDMAGPLLKAAGDLMADLEAIIHSFTIDINVNMPRIPGGGGGGGGGRGGGGGSGNVPQMANGGIASGPLSGFRAILHGTEAVIPLKNGSVPVSLNAAGLGGGMTLNFSFVYAPTVSTADRHEAADMIAPLIIDRIRQEFTKRNL